MTTSTDKIKKQIAALLAKAEGTDNEFEAATFMAKVNELLEKYQIEMHEVRQAGEDNDPLGREEGTTNLYASMGWARDVAGSLARYYGARMIFRKVGNHYRYTVLGRESARMTFELMLPFVISQVRIEAKRLLERRNEGTRSTWERQIGHALWVRIHALLPKAEERRAELTANALVPISDVDALVEQEFSNLKKGKDRKIKFSGDAVDAANKVSLHHQATGTGRTKLLK
jgi:hypothetical protein